MGTTTEKLQAILNSKAAIKAAIEGKGVENVGDVLSTYADAISSIPTGGGGWTGHADVEGLKAIGWTDEDIAYYQQHGVNWDEEDDAYHLVPENNKVLYGVININNIADYADILVYMPKIDTTGVTTMVRAFYRCISLVAIPTLDTSSVTTMMEMFAICRSLVCIPTLDTSKVIDINGIFSGCYSLTSIPRFDTSNLTVAVNAFNGCSSLVSLPDLAFPRLGNAKQIAFNCYSLKSIKFPNAKSVTDTYAMLLNCYSLTFIEMDVSLVTNIDIMINGCSSLRWCQLYGLTISITIPSTILEKSSLIYVIENAAPTDAIVITLSAYCYNKFNSDPDVVAALSAQPLVSLASA